MICGDKGHVGANGQPCGQVIAPTAKACVWHATDAEGRRALALKGGIASRMKSVATLPDSTPSPVLSDPAGVRRVLTETIQQARTGKLDHRIAAVVIQGVVAAVKLAELEVAAQIGDLERRFRLRRA